MKVKIFSGAFPDDVERSINEWLTANGDMVRVTDTNLAFSGVGADNDANQMLLVAVWYSEL